VKWLEDFLKARPLWVLACDILTKAKKPITEDGKRWLRAVASESEWMISGNRGYKHVIHSNQDELDVFYARLGSQIAAMKNRIEAVRRNKATLN